MSNAAADRSDSCIIIDLDPRITPQPPRGKHARAACTPQLHVIPGGLAPDSRPAADGRSAPAAAPASTPAKAASRRKPSPAHAAASEPAAQPIPTRRETAVRHLGDLWAGIQGTPFGATPGERVFVGVGTAVLFVLSLALAVMQPAL